MAQFELVKEEFATAGASVVYIAAEKRGGMFKPEKFFAQHPISLPFLLDENRAVTKAYGVYHRLGKDAFNIAHPATFIVGSDGTLRWIYVGENQHDRAPLERVLEQVRE